LQIRSTNRPPELVVGRSTALSASLTTTHLQRLSELLPQFEVLDCDSLVEIVKRLGGPIEVVYLYCHGRRQMFPAGNGQSTYLEVGDGEAFQPRDIAAWQVADWPKQHWRDTSPLVFINGCHTAEITPESLTTFVDSFTKAYAAGVIGTEITVDQPFANEAAEEFFRRFHDGRTSVGQALQQMRMHFLVKGNLLGLVYTPYCSTGLMLMVA